MNSLVILIILSGISIIFNSLSDYPRLILGILIICNSISILSKRKFAYYSAIVLYSAISITMAYSMFHMLIFCRFEFAPFIMVGFTLLLSCSVFFYLKNNKSYFNKGI